MSSNFHVAVTHHFAEECPGGYVARAAISLAGKLGDGRSIASALDDRYGNARGDAGVGTAGQGCRVFVTAASIGRPGELNRTAAVAPPKRQRKPRRTAGRAGAQLTAPICTDMAAVTGSQAGLEWGGAGRNKHGRDFNSDVSNLCLSDGSFGLVLL